MQLLLYDETNTLDPEFGQWLLPKIRMKILGSVSKYNFHQWDNYISTSEVFPRMYKRPYKTNEIIGYLSSQVVSKGSKGLINIHINPDSFVPGFDRLKSEVLAKTINYGTLEVKGVPIFTDVFSYFEKNIHVFVDLYYYNVAAKKEE